MATRREEKNTNVSKCSWTLRLISHQPLLQLVCVWSLFMSWRTTNTTTVWDTTLKRATDQSSRRRAPLTVCTAVITPFITPLAARSVHFCPHVAWWTENVHQCPMFIGSCLSGLSVHPSNHLPDPRAEGRDFGVDAGWLLCPAGVAPRRDTINHPPASGTLAHQRTPAVTTATVHAPLRMCAAGTEHAVCKCTVEMLLAVAAGQQWERRLLKGLGVGTTWGRSRRSSWAAFTRIWTTACLMTPTCGLIWSNPV